MKSCRRRVGLLSLAVGALFALIGPGVASANTVTDWNAYAAPILLNPPQDGRVGVLHLAMMHGAMYDAVNAIDGRYGAVSRFASCRSGRLSGGGSGARCVSHPEQPLPGE